MKIKLSILFIFLYNLIFSQPEMIVDPNIMLNSLEVFRHNMQDTTNYSYLEGHYKLGDNRYIKYITTLANVGNEMACYGNPETDTINWSFNNPHNHPHYKEGIKVKLYRWTNSQWNLVSYNEKLSYDMVNQSKYPGGFYRVYDWSIPGWVNRYINFYLIDEQDSYFHLYSSVDSNLARINIQYCQNDIFYTCGGDLSYIEENKCILPYYEDTYSGVPGNWNHIPDSADGFYRLKAWHTPHFEQKNLFPDTVDVIFYLQGDNIIHDTIPLVQPVCNSDTIPTSITAITGRGSATGEVILQGISATETCPFRVERLIAIGNNETNWNISGVVIVNKSEFIDYNAPVGLPIRYRTGNVISNRVKYK